MKREAIRKNTFEEATVLRKELEEHRPDCYVKVQRRGKRRTNKRQYFVVKVRPKPSPGDE